MQLSQRLFVSSDVCQSLNPAREGWRERCTTDVTPEPVCSTGYSSTCSPLYTTVGCLACGHLLRRVWVAIGLESQPRPESKNGPIYREIRNPYSGQSPILIPTTIRQHSARSTTTPNRAFRKVQASGEIATSPQNDAVASQQN